MSLLRLGRGASCAALAVATLAIGPALAPSAAAGTLPASFQESTVFSGLTNPTVVRFSPDGRVFVAEKSGLIKVFDDLSDTTPTVFADLSTNVYNFWDRGLLGMALDPGFPATPYVYVLYTYDKDPNSPTVPRWGTPGVLSDPCPTPPGATGDGCLVSGRLSRLTASGNTWTGTETPLITDWCQQYPSHSIGSLQFGADGALYVSGGDGASFNFTDYGQDGNPLNPCGDPPAGIGGTETPPTAEGGALRSQDVRTSADPATLDGAVLRVDPATGAALPDNPRSLDPDPNVRRIVANGFRNPFRFTIRPGTNDVWVGDVGWNDWEEIDHVGLPTAATNFGWPCYEGAGRQPGYDGANLNICEQLYAQSNAVVAPYYTYNHAAKVVTGETCPTGGSSISGLAFYNGGNYPATYADALFFADYSRNCIWVMQKGTNGLPDPATRATFDAGAAAPVDLQIGPNGDLFYVDFTGGTIRRIRYFGANQPPNAVASATPTAGPAPLTVSFDGSGSNDPENDPLTYAWDLDGDGAFDDSTAVNPTFTYSSPGTYTVRLQVGDGHGNTSVSLPLTISANNTAPSATIASPGASVTWRVGDTISFSGSASDAQEGTLPPSALSWSLVLRHCSSDGSSCHSHALQTFAGVATGSFSAPDHEYPSYLELTLTATDSGGLTDSKTVRLDPKTVNLTFATDPSGLQLTVGSSSGTTPFMRTAIIGSTNSLSAPTTQTLGGQTYQFSSWSDGGAQAHNVVAPATPATYTASYVVSAGQPGPVAAYAFNEGSGATAADASGNGNGGTLSGAAWTGTGKFGGALSFDGVNDWVTVNDTPSLDLTNGMTVEAWVQPRVLKGSWRAVTVKEGAAVVYGLHANAAANRPAGRVLVNGASYDARGTPLPANTWSHLAATYDGAVLRLYVNGSEVGTRAVSGSVAASAGALRIGGNSLAAEWFGGVIDEVRIYNRALVPTEIQNDMNTPIGSVPPPNDTTPPSSPTNLAATTAVGSATLGWTASSDNVGVVRYNVHRSTTAGFAPSAANRIAQPTSNSYVDSGLAGGTYYYRVTAEDAAGNVSAASNEATAVVPSDQAPSVSVTAPAGGTTVSGTIDVTASASDDVAVLGVRFLLDGAPLGTEDTSAPYSVPWMTTTASNGPHQLTAVARDGAGHQTTSPVVNVTVSNAAPPPPSGLVAAYSLNSVSGTTVADVSGNGNTGTVSGAAAAAGKYGGGLSFDGVNDWVTVNDSNSLDLTTGMTLMAWVNPSALAGSWRTVVFKEGGAGSIDYSLYAAESTNKPVGQVYVGGEQNVLGTTSLAPNVWSHLAVTYDGATLKLYVNGAVVGSKAVSGAITPTTGALRIGGNNIWSEWFQGLIDEVRIYGRALTQAEIQTDMSTPLTP
jgi:glucose/arabinose dehydrogenase